MEEKTQGWLDTATKGIRFGPDRRAVRKELADHLEDKQAALCRAFPDIPPEEAEQRALDSMGDPAEIGRELARLHRPWLGYLWRASQMLLALCLLWTIGAGPVNRWQGQGAEWRDSDDLPCFDGVELAQARYLPGEDPDQLLALEPELEQAVQGQDVALLRAALWQEGERQALYLYLRVDTWRFWEVGMLRGEWMRVTDSLGNAYPLEETAQEWTSSLGCKSFGPFHNGYELRLGDLDPAADWIRLDYGPGETLFSFTVELKEGAA